MPRNPKTHAYITLGFPHDLAAWNDLQAEARQRDMSVPRLIKLILVDRQNSLRAQGHAVHAQNVPQVRTGEGRQDRPGQPPTSHPRRQAHETHGNEQPDMHLVTHNAAAAAAFWDDGEGMTTIT